MSAPTRPEVWLRGPLSGIDPVLMPAAHTLVQAREDITAAAAGASDADLWARPGALMREGEPGAGADQLVAEAQSGIDRAIIQLGHTTLKIARGLRAPPAA
jgi:hypothetical protein